MLYPKIVAGFEPNERGEDAVKLGELLADAVGGHLSQVHVERGSPARELYAIAERGEADLIVLGATHRASFGAVAPGSVAEHLLKGARCRLAIAPRGYLRARATLAAESAGADASDIPASSPLPLVRPKLRVIGVGLDGSLESRAALGEASEIAGQAGASIRVIGVSSPIPKLGAQTANAPVSTGSRLEAIVHDAARALPAELRAQPIVERGEPVERLLDRAGQGLDLLVLGSRGFGPVMRIMIGSVSTRIIRQAPCPVLVVPRPDA